MNIFVAVVLCSLVNEIAQAIPDQAKISESHQYFKIYYYNKNDTSRAQESSKSPVVFKNDNLKTVFIIHGWNTDDLERPEKLKKAIFEARKDVGRVVIVDWSKDSKGPYGFVSSVNAPRTAKSTANEMARIISYGMTSPSNVEIIGHSLGAHIAGQAARRLKEGGVGTISVLTGLDPPGAGYNPGSPHHNERLQKGDADKVRVIHTNSRLLGTREDMGDEDIWVNGGRLQPQCEDKLLWQKDRCSHSAAWDAGELDQRGIPLYEPTDQSLGKNYKAPRKMSVNILVLDVSPSMQDYGRIQGLVVSSRRFVTSLPVSYHLGIIIFGGYARESSPVVNISSESVRQSLLSILPTESTEISSTSIGAGLQAALRSAKSVSSDCPDFILITDGEENAHPTIEEVRPQLEKSCSKVNAIALGPQADSKLEQLAADTKGRMFTVSDQNKDQNIFDSLAQSLLDSSDAQMDSDSRPIKLPTKTLAVDDPDPVIYTFDETVGKDTKFSISSPNIDRMEAELISPSGISYGRSSYSLDPQSHEIVFKMEDVIPGNWGVKLKTADEQNDVNRKKRSTDNSRDWATIFVTTNPKSSDSSGVESPIRLEAILNSTTIFYPDWVKIEAAVRKGDSGIIFADVIATLKSPNGNITTLKLRDDGAAADELKNDGIYSRFITYLEGAGRYEVSVIATNAENTARVATGSGAPKELGPFERSVNVASLKAVGKFVKPLPAAVTDLKIMDVDLDKHTVGLRWTAPGDHADIGTATSYSLKVTSKSDWTSPEVQFVFTEADVVDKGSLVPLSAGEVQSVTLRIPEQIWEEATEDHEQWVPVKLYFTVQATNSESRIGEISNVAESATFYQLIVMNSGASIKPFLLSAVIISLVRWCLI